MNAVAKIVLNDWQRGKLPYFVAPPETPEEEAKRLAKKKGGGRQSKVDIVKQNFSKVDVGLEFGDADVREMQPQEEEELFDSDNEQVEDEEDDEPYSDEEEEDDDLEDEDARAARADFFAFGNSLTVKGRLTQMSFWNLGTIFLTFSLSLPSIFLFRWNSYSRRRSAKKRWEAFH